MFYHIKNYCTSIYNLQRTTFISIWRVLYVQLTAKWSDPKSLAFNIHKIDYIKNSINWFDTFSTPIYYESHECLIKSYLLWKLLSRNLGFDFQIWLISLEATVHMSFRHLQWSQLILKLCFKFKLCVFPGNWLFHSEKNVKLLIEIQWKIREKMLMEWNIRNNVSVAFRLLVFRIVRFVCFLCVCC